MFTEYTIFSGKMHHRRMKEVGLYKEVEIKDNFS